MVELVGWCNAGDPNATNDALARLRAAFRLRTAHRLRYVPLGGDTEFDLQVVAASKFDAPAEGYKPTVAWSITLEAPDPRAFAAALTTVSYLPGAMGAYGPGLRIPLEFPLVLTEPGGGGGLEFLSAFNGGTYETPVLLSLLGPVGGLRSIRNRTSGEEVDFNLIALQAGDELTVNTGTHVTEINGELRPDVIDASTTSWFELQVGQNALDVDGDGFLAGVTRLTATYREAMI
jgi:hypothetical protein